ncbi:MAG TPA: hypothetical protein PLO51_01055, partial [Candidatus Micrarchaeota archaeon]|nr:hypothetical protein [Candidatus Micrarchaeota archaeon]
MAYKIENNPTDNQSNTQAKVLSQDELKKIISQIGAQKGTVPEMKPEVAKQVVMELIKWKGRQLEVALVVEKHIDYFMHLEAAGDKEFSSAWLNYARKSQPLQEYLYGALIGTGLDKVRTALLATGQLGESLIDSWKNATENELKNNSEFYKNFPSLKDKSPYIPSDMATTQEEIAAQNAAMKAIFGAIYDFVGSRLSPTGSNSWTMPFIGNLNFGRDVYNLGKSL